MEARAPRGNGRLAAMDASRVIAAHPYSERISWHTLYLYIPSSLLILI